MFVSIIGTDLIYRNKQHQVLSLISILIPTRNEAENLPHLFAQLQKLHYPPLEILFLDDESEDKTAAILQDEAASHENWRYIAGKPLPAGWLGKNWACHQLAVEAKGDFLLFLDADIARLHPKVLESSLAQMQAYDLSLLSLFPDQIMKSRGELTVVPLMHYLLLTLLPLRWVYRFSYPLMAAANGQFMFFRAKDYRENLWHQQARQAIIEDIEIMRQVKRAGKKGMALLADGMIQTRMYRAYREALQGFSKNILAGFGNSIGLLLVYLAFVFGIGIWFILAWQVFAAALFMILLLRIISSKIAGQTIGTNLLFHFVQMVNLLIISFLSIQKRIRKNNQWKGRNVQLT